MIDTLTKRPITVSALSGDGAPYLMIQLDQLDLVKKLPR